MEKKREVELIRQQEAERIANLERLRLAEEEKKRMERQELEFNLQIKERKRRAAEDF